MTALHPVMDSGGGPNELLEAALFYAAAGLRVFPVHSLREGVCSCGHPDCEHPGKHPMTRHGLHDATTEESVIRRWWRDCPDANVAIRSEDIGIVLDVDPRNGGDESFDKLTASNTMPDTVEVLTGGGGRHFWFRGPTVKTEELKRHGWPGLDIKSGGGYVVAPPSLHASGRRYEFEGCSDFVLGQTIGEAPSFVLAICNQPSAVRKVEGFIPSLTPAPPEQLQAVRDALSYIDPDEDYHTWIKVGQALNSALWTEGFDLWDDWSSRGSKYPGSRRLLWKWNSFNPIAQKGVSLNSIHYLAKERGRKPAAPTTTPAASEEFTLPIIKFDDLSTILEYPPRKWVFEDWLPYGTAALFHGQGGTGKTRLSLQAAIAAILLKNLFGWEPNVSGPVVFISGEEPADSAKRMVWEICESFSLSPQERLIIGQQLHVIDLTQARSPILYTADGWTQTGAEVLTRIRQLEAVLGVLDNASSCYGGPATETAHIYTFVNGYAAAFGERGAGLLLSHENKASAVSKNREHAYGGVTTWHNACRARIEMYPDTTDKNVRRIGRPKSNYAALMGEDDALCLVWHHGAWQQQIKGGLVDGIRRENNVTQVTEYVRAVLAVARDNVSPNPKARNNPIAIGKDYELACHVKGNAFWSALEEAVARGFLKLEKYQKHNREWSERFIK